MTQPSEIYVDPSIAGDSGAGTSGDPYGDLEYGIEQTTFDTTNGTRVNILAGTDEILAADLSTALADTSVSVAWAPSESAPLIFEGYTSTAGDGGIGGIDGNGGGVLVNANQDYVHFKNLHLHNGGSARIIDMDNQCSVIRCEIDNTTDDAISLDTDAYVVGNYIHNCGGRGVLLSYGVVMFNWLENGTNDFSIGIYQALSSIQTTIYRNVLQLDGTSDGITLDQFGNCLNNSVWSNGGTGQGINTNGTNELLGLVQNNLVEGFSGTGGIGYDLDQSGTAIFIYGGNAAYDNATNYTGIADYYIDRLGTGDTNETLSASPFVDAANGDFTPVDTGSVKDGSLPSVFGDGQHSGTGAYAAWKGAIQPAGGNLFHPAAVMKNGLLQR